MRVRVIHAIVASASFLFLVNRGECFFGECLGCLRGAEKEKATGQRKALLSEENRKQEVHQVGEAALPVVDPEDISTSSIGKSRKDEDGSLGILGKLRLQLKNWLGRGEENGEPPVEDEALGPTDIVHTSIDEPLSEKRETQARLFREMTELRQKPIADLPKDERTTALKEMRENQANLDLVTQEITLLKARDSDAEKGSEQGGNCMFCQQETEEKICDHGFLAHSGCLGKAKMTREDAQAEYCEHCVREMAEAIMKGEYVG